MCEHNLINLDWVMKEVLLFLTLLFFIEKYGENDRLTNK